jgi:hypothetical protein
MRIAVSFPVITRLRFILITAMLPGLSRASGVDGE